MKNIMKIKSDATEYNVYTKEGKFVGTTVQVVIIKEEPNHLKKARELYKEVANSIVLDEFSDGKYNPIIDMKEAYEKYIKQLENK